MAERATVLAGASLAILLLMVLAADAAGPRAPAVYRALAAGYELSRETP